MPAARLPRHLWALAGLYGFASLLHFAHNAEYIAFYPGMPAWLARGHVYAVWLAITGVGALGVGLLLIGWRRTALATLAAWGAFGLDALGHYTLALCSEHTFAMNFTIWLEAVTGVLLAVVAAWRMRPAGGLRWASLARA
jgi:hypothetical protein